MVRSSLPSAEVPAVLIVDDDPDILLLLSKLLESRDYRVATADSGRAALSLAARLKPQVVLLDYMMPDLSGLEVLGKLRQRDAAIQVLIITGHGSEETATAFLKAGALDYIPKPFDNDRILAAVAGAFDNRRLFLEKVAREQARESESRSLKAAVAEKSLEAEDKSRKLETALEKVQKINRTLKERNREISRLEYLYREIFDRAGDGIVKTDTAGVITVANRMAGIILGHPFIKGRYIQSFFPEPSRPKVESLLKRLATGKVRLEEMEAEVTPNDETVTLNLRGVPLWRKGVVAEMEILITDVTERIRQQQLVQKLKERAIIAGFSRHLSHVLLNSLTVAGGYLHKLTRSMAGQDGAAWGVVTREMTNMEEVVRGYQDYVDIINLKPSSAVGLTSFLRRFLESATGRDNAEIARIIGPSRDDIRLAWNLPDGPESTAVVDPAFLNLGLAYLIRGAAYYAAQIGNRPLDMEVSLAVNPPWATIMVASLGTRTPSEVITTMFSPWDHQMLSQTFDHWGITIANSVAERHGGKLAVAPDHRGTIFRFILPLAVEAQSAPGANPV